MLSRRIYDRAAYFFARPILATRELQERFSENVQ